MGSFVQKLANIFSSKDAETQPPAPTAHQAEQQPLVSDPLAKLRDLLGKIAVQRQQLAAEKQALAHFGDRLASFATQLPDDASDELATELQLKRSRLAALLAASTDMHEKLSRQESAWAYLATRWGQQLPADEIAAAQTDELGVKLADLDIQAGELIAGGQQLRASMSEDELGRVFQRWANAS